MPEYAHPKIIIIVLNWNGGNDTVECIESVTKIDYSNYQIVLVDNGSADHSVDLIREKFPEVFIIENHENLGFAEGNNVGIRYALESDAKYVWLLNNDTIVDPHALLSMVDIAENQKDVGILGSKIYYYNSPDILWFAGATINWKLAASEHVGRMEKDNGQYEVMREVDRVTGCSMLIRDGVFETAGLFDEKFFLYAEEVDLCVRAKNKGYKIMYVPGSIVHHKISLSSGENSGPLFVYYNTRNFLYLIRKHLSFPKREIYMARNIFRKLWMSKGTIVRMFIPRTFLEKENEPIDIAPLVGMLHFFTGRMKKGGFDYFMNQKYHKPKEDM